jgi:hypothetical protein
MISVRGAGGLRSSDRLSAATKQKGAAFLARSHLAGLFLCPLYGVVCTLFCTS